MPLPTRDSAPPPALHGDASVAYRRLILALVTLGAVGLLAELLLLEHYDDPWQWAPLVALGLTVVAMVVQALRPSRAALRAFQAVMVACVLLGGVGVALHLKGNIEFELEGAPDLRGWPLYREALRGAVPALAPGALAQLGLLGLLYAYRHPAGRSPAEPSPPSLRNSS